MEPSLRERVLQTIAADPRGHLARGREAYVSYGGELLDLGLYRHVTVLDADAGDGTIALVQHRCRRMRLPKAVVLLPAEGSGVLLLAAARNGATETVRVLVGCGVHVAVIDDDYNTPLHLACAESRADTACCLLEAGAVDHPLARNLRFITPGGMAVMRGLTKVLCTLNASPGQKDFACGAFKRLPLVAAAWCGDLEGVKAQLLQPGVVVDAVAPEHSTALSAAVEHGHLAIMALLIAARADVNHRCGVTPDTQNGSIGMPLTLRAVVHGQVEALSLLLASAADPDAANMNDGIAPLHYAGGQGHRSMVQLLLDARASVDAPIGAEMIVYKHPAASTPLSLTVASGHEAVVKMLLARRANVNSRACSPAGRYTYATPLHYTLVAPAPEVVRVLCAARADVDARAGLFSTAGGLTPLMAAAVANNSLVVEALLSCGADPDLKCTGLMLGCSGWRGTALDMAKRYRRAAAQAALEARAVQKEARRAPKKVV